MSDLLNQLPVGRMFRPTPVRVNGEPTPVARAAALGVFGAAGSRPGPPAR